jgi:hypothetical protein
MWEYSISAQRWIYQSGSQLGTAAGAPTGREAAVTWVDSSGKFWLFAGSTRVTVTFSTGATGIDNAYLSASGRIFKSSRAALRGQEKT